jgi:spore maturation protein CgeB
MAAAQRQSHARYVHTPELEQSASRSYINISQLQHAMYLSSLTMPCYELAGCREQHVTNEARDKM